MKNKSIISLTIAFAIVAVGCTGLLLYFGLKPQAVTAIHVLFGLLFIGFIIFHIRNNWSSLKVYTRERGTRTIQKEFFLALGIFMLLAIGAASGLPPFGPLVHAGENLTRGEGREGNGKFSMSMFASINTNKDKPGTGLHFIIQKKNEVHTPVIAIWVEDTARQFIQNLFVPSKTIQLPAGEDNIREALEEGEAKIEKLSPAQLPQWQSKTKDTAFNFAEATPTDNFFLDTKTVAAGKYHIVVEVRDNEKSELYESEIDMSKSNAFTLHSNGNLLLEKAIVIIDK